MGTPCPGGFRIALELDRALARPRRSGPSGSGACEPVCRRGARLPKKVDDLAQKNLLVVDQSSYVERLSEIKKKIPELKWSVTTERSTEQIMEAVWARKVDCTIADSNIVAINRRYFPELVVAFPLSDEVLSFGTLEMLPGGEYGRVMQAVAVDGYVYDLTADQGALDVVTLVAPEAP